MVDIIQEQYGLPVNSDGALLLDFVTGSDVQTGILPPGALPINTLTKRLAVHSPSSPPGVASFHLIVESREASLDLPTVPTAYVWSSVVSDTYGAYSNGVITFPFSGVFDFFITANPVTSGSTKRLITGTQIFDGSSWSILEYSAQQTAVRQADKHKALFSSSGAFQAGTKLKFDSWGSAATISLLTETPYTGYNIPASRLVITGVQTS